MGLLFHMSGLDFTTHGSNLKTPDPLGSLNCKCDLVAHSSLSVDPFAHGDTIPMIFSLVYDIYSDISEPREIFYIFMKVLHQIGNNIYGIIHDMATTHEDDFVESFDALWERVCRDIFYIIDYASISEYGCRKNHSYDSPPSSNDKHQGASPHVLCLQYIDALMHDLGIHNIFTNSITKNLFL